MTISHTDNSIRIIILFGVLSLLLINTAFGNGNRNDSISTRKVKLSGREIIWATTHPFIALKVQRLTKRALFITDSLEKAGVLADGSGGQLDAFKHSFWMALLAQNINGNKARKLGDIHEKVNYRQFKRGRANQDSTASLMDLKNNDIGIIIGKQYSDLSEKKLAEEIIKQIKNGLLFITSKDKDGNYLNCRGEKIPIEKTNKWNKGRCLKPSSFNYS